MKRKWVYRISYYLVIIAFYAYIGLRWDVFYAQRGQLLAAAFLLCCLLIAAVTMELYVD